MNETHLEIKELGHRGDGIAFTDEGPVYVAGALPGETIRVRMDGNRADLIEIIVPSPDRVAPVCTHDPASGSCFMQHLAEQPYLVWKRSLVENALRSAGITTEVSETVAATAGGRRRAVFSAARKGRSVVLGYYGRASHDLFDAAGCAVLTPQIERSLAGLKELAALVLPKKGDLRVTVLETTAGLDVALEKAAASYDRQIAALCKKAADLGLARLSVNGEILLEIRPPLLDMGGTGIVPPPGGFTQATVAAEEALAQLVVQGAGKSKWVADLFSGIGTFALRLARVANVHAVEGDAAAIAAFDRALRKPQGLKKVTFERRDLFRRPLVRDELEPFNAVVFDPPRAGAQAQAEQLARSKVKTIVAVSCNPATFARDVKILMEGGYTLKSVTPVDQFQFSPHIEVVGVLMRE
ncbi:class I SAM-dependent RNA methyltransferase [Roseibium denhamense]|nr:class I SAM-dependent RNA methyltransferase [Roseibium denhamense]MTI05180.1 class I SAM-dependent RNA methyltransferase [Roseibium denhamense]